MKMKLTTFTIFATFAILFLSLSGADALGDPYLGKNITVVMNESHVIFETLLDFEILEEKVKHPLILDYTKVQGENETQKPATKKKNVYRLNFLGVIFSLIFMPFILMLSLFGYLVALCIFCIHEFAILFFTGIFVFLMILFKQMN
jgi:hypothetical protein